MAAVRRALANAGHRLRYSRRPDRKGYYVEGRPQLDEHLRHLMGLIDFARLEYMVAGAVAVAAWAEARSTFRQHFLRQRALHGS